MILKEVTSYLATNVGTILNPTKISNIFANKEHIKMVPDTIRRYVPHLEDAFMISLAQRFDLKGNEVINGSCKYYFNDMGIRNAAAGYKGLDQEPPSWKM